MIQSIRNFFGAMLNRKYDTLDLFKEVYGTRLTKSGATVNSKTALEVSTVLACCRVIAEGCAQVPFKLMKSVGGEKQEARDHPLFDVLYRNPNSWQTSFAFRETIALHLVLKGNAYVFLGKVGSKRELRELIPLDPNCVEFVKGKSNSFSYRYRDETTEIEFPSSSIWHIRGPSWNSYLGLEAVSLAREAIGLASSLESAHSAIHKSGARITGVYSVDGTLSQAKYDMLLKYLKERSQGGELEGAPLVLDQGAKWLQQSMTGVDSQHLETRRHQIEEICAALRVFPVMIGHSDKSLGLSIEQVFIAHVVHSMMPWYVRIEQSAEKSLLTEDDLKSGHYIKFFPNGLMRGAAKDRSEFYRSAIGSVNATPGWMTINEIRQLEDLPPIDGGEKLFIPQSTPKTSPKEEPQP